MFGEELFKRYYRLNNFECFCSMSKCERARGLRFNVTLAVTVETTGHDLDALGIVSPYNHHRYTGGGEIPEAKSFVGQSRDYIFNNKV